MENPLLGQEPLPPFALIRPEHVEPGVRELLARGRARIEQLSTLERPTFATVVEPLEELQHQVSRTWSPVSHLNAVLNSDALRAGYNWLAVGENIAEGAANAEVVVQGWLKSPGHCVNIMSPQFREMGLAYFTDFAHKGDIYWAQTFGTEKKK